MKKTILTLGLLMGCASLSFAQYPMWNPSTGIYLPYSNGNNYIRPATTSHYTYFDASAGVGIGHQGQYSGYRLHVHGKTNLNGDVGIHIGNTLPTTALDVNGDSYFVGNMGIGIAPNVNYKLNLFTQSTVNGSTPIYAQHGNWQYGVAARLIGGREGVIATGGMEHTTGTQPTWATGVHAVAGNGSNSNTGVFGYTSASGLPTNYAYGFNGTAGGGTVANYGIYTTASSQAGPAYAGYFSGNVYTTGVYQSSDAVLKENIKPLSNSARFMLLSPVEYTYKRGQYASMNLTEGVQMGFIAQDLEKVFPELVMETVQPPEMDENGNIIGEPVHFKSVNYVGLIPIMTATIQEQNVVIERQENTIKELTDRIARLENAMTVNTDEVELEAVLFQNSPNPFNERTVITYSVPKSAQSASLMIFDLNGSLQLTKQLSVSANGQCELTANELKPGMYVYSLIVDGKEVSSKRMILTE